MGRGGKFEKKKKTRKDNRPPPFLLRVGQESVNIILHFLGEKKKIALPKRVDYKYYYVPVCPVVIHRIR